MTGDPRSIRRFCALAGLALALSGAAAQTTPSEPDQTPPASVTDTLGGPSVEPSAIREGTSADTMSTSMVRRTFDGSVELPSIPAGIAAIEMMALDEATRAKVDAVLAERAAVMDRILIENYDLFIEAATAAQSGRGYRASPEQRAADRRERGPRQRKLIEALAPLRERGELADEVRSVLGAGDQAQFDVLMDSYKQAFIEQQLAQREGAPPAATGDGPAPIDLGTPMNAPTDAPMDMDDADRQARPDRPAPTDRPARSPQARPERTADRALSPQRIEFQLTTRQWLLEVGGSLQRVVVQRAEQFNQFLDALNMAPERKEQVRLIVIEATSKGLNGPDAEASRRAMNRMFSRLFAELGPEERRALYEAIRDQRGDAALPTGTD